MKATINFNGSSFDVEGAGQKELFEEIAKVHEIFSDEKCGLCGNQEAKRFNVRSVDDNKYYEKRCICGAILSYGQHKKGGTLFPKRKNDDGQEIGKYGWHKFVPSAQGKSV